jgi:hypothetical protein
VDSAYTWFLTILQTQGYDSNMHGKVLQDYMDSYRRSCADTVINTTPLSMTRFSIGLVISKGPSSSWCNPVPTDLPAEMWDVDTSHDNRQYLCLFYVATSASDTDEEDVDDETPYERDTTFPSNTGRMYTDSSCP